MKKISGLTGILLGSLICHPAEWDGIWDFVFPLLAVAFLHDPDLLFLDEPTTGLDPKATRLVWEKIRGGSRKDKTILVSTHSMEEVDKYCDRVIVLNGGKIVENDTPARIREKLNVDYFFDAYFQLIEGEKS